MTTRHDDAGLVTACPACGQANRIAWNRVGATARCGKCHRDLPHAGGPVEVRDASTFDRIVSEAAVPVLVDFWAPWCGPCRVVAPELEKVASARAGHLLVVKVNTDVLPELGARYRIRSIPTMVLFDGGAEAARTSGAMPASDITRFVAQAAAAAARPD